MKHTNSPWGKVQDSDKFSDAEDVYIVGTAGHGGLVMPSSLAKELKIQKFGETQGGNAWFEEDCQISVAIMALILNNLYKPSDSQIKSCLLSIACWNNEYLTETNLSDYGIIGSHVSEIKEKIGSELGEILIQVENRKKEEKMRKNKDPELVISARGLNSLKDLFQFLNISYRSEANEESILRDLTKKLSSMAMLHESDLSDIANYKLAVVTTADGMEHLVTNYDSYNCPNLLSKCRIFATFN